MSRGPGVTETVLLYGLRIESELPLHQHRPLPAGEVVDVRIRVGDPGAATAEPPPGRLLLDLHTDRALYSASELAGGGYLMRFYGTCDFAIDATCSAVTLHLVPGADPELAAVLAAGTLLSFLLALRGHPVLHASAVQVGEQAVGFVGASGMGKSTMATLMCAAGAQLITDDVLRLDLDGTGAPRCHLGATELRLRKAAGALAERFADRPAQRLTSDARDALRMPPATRLDLPLTALVVPLPDHSGERRQAEIVRMAPTEALLTLLRFPRVLGWSDPQVLARQFQQLGDIVERVPIYWARLPWGPPFPADIASMVLDAVAQPSPR